MSDAPLIDLYDSEILAAEKVLESLHESQRKSKNLEAFRKEIMGRFEEIGLRVDVKVWTTTQEGVFGFEVEIIGRTENVKWDPDKMVHEVRTDILDLLPASEKGQWLKSSGGIDLPPGRKH